MPPTGPLTEMRDGYGKSNEYLLYTSIVWMIACVE